jgi:hypothetical protein
MLEKALGSAHDRRRVPQVRDAPDIDNSFLRRWSSGSDLCRAGRLDSSRAAAPSAHRFEDVFLFGSCEVPEANARLFSDVFH